MDYLLLSPSDFLGCFAAPLLAAWVACVAALPDEGWAVKTVSLCDDGGREWVEAARAKGLFDRSSPLTGMVDHSDEVIRFFRREHADRHTRHARALHPVGGMVLRRHTPLLRAVAGALRPDLPTG